MPFDAVWHNIQVHAGQEFWTVKDHLFTYEAHEGYIRPSRTNQNISQSDFRKAYELFPLRGPGEIAKLVRGSAYVYAVLSDPRIHD